MDEKKEQSSAWHYPSLGKVVETLPEDRVSQEPADPAKDKQAELDRLISECNAMKAQLSGKLNELEQCLTSVNKGVVSLTDDLFGHLAGIISTAIKKIANVEISNNKESLIGLFRTYFSSFNEKDVISVKVSPELKKMLLENGFNLDYEVKEDPNLCMADVTVDLSDKVISVDTNAVINSWLDTNYGQ